jgi:hypothetical protein
MGDGGLSVGIIPGGFHRLVLLSASAGIAML